MRKMDKILGDRGYFSYANYEIAIKKYGVIPLILPKKGFSLAKLEKLVPFSLFWFGTKEGTEKINELKEILAKCKREIQNSEELAEESGTIELVFKCAKEILPFDNLHKYTKKSLEKGVAMNALLLGLIIALEVRKKENIQRLITC